jgi:hypothetical protein
MSKVTLEFNLPDEQSEYFQASNGAKFHSVLWDVTHEFRQRWKYNEKRECTWDEVWELLWDVYNDNNFDPYTEE